MKLEFLWKVYNLELETSTYQNNWRTYFGLVDTDPDELGHFCDISENHTELDDDLIFNSLPWHEAIVINYEFIACFSSGSECKMWIRDNIPECVDTGDLEWRPVFYIKNKKKIKIKNQNVQLVIWHYEPNRNLYIGLFDEGEKVFIDITRDININDDNYWVKVTINDYFISHCFDWDIDKAKKWCMKNLHCEDCEWEPSLAFSKEAIQWLQENSITWTETERSRDCVIDRPDWKKIEWVVTNLEIMWYDINLFRVYIDNKIVYEEKLINEEFQDYYLLDIVDSFNYK